MAQIHGLEVTDSPSSAFPIHKFLIEGAWTTGGAETFLTVTSPATGQCLGYVPLATRADAARAVEAARRSKAKIARMSVWDRARMCHRIADAMEARKEDLARVLTLEQGKPLATEARLEIAAACASFRDAGEQIKWLETDCFPVEAPGKRVFNYLQPKGVFALVTPWNFPIALPATYYLGPGLAAGNALAWVPAPTTSICAVKLMECLEEADVPTGIVNMVTGEGPQVGDAVIVHPQSDAVAFTGSAETGQIVAERGAGKPLLLELGGNGPTIVMADADLELAAKRIATGCYANAGQICTATERILVHEAVHDRLVEGLLENTERVVLGDPLDEATTMGPLNNRSCADKVEDHVNEALENGAELHAGGGRRGGMPSDLYFEPTVLTNVQKDTKINRLETFGPVAPVLKFKDDAQLWDIVDASSFGLSASVFTTRIKDALQIGDRLRHGIVNINDMSCYWEMAIPAGGAAGKHSGIGRTGGKHTITEMSDLKTITIDLNA